MSSLTKANVGCKASQRKYILSAYLFVEAAWLYSSPLSEQSNSAPLLCKATPTRNVNSALLLEHSLVVRAPVRRMGKGSKKRSGGGGKGKQHRGGGGGGKSRKQKEDSPVVAKKKVHGNAFPMPVGLI